MKKRIGSTLSFIGLWLFRQGLWWQGAKVVQIRNGYLPNGSKVFIFACGPEVLGFDVNLNQPNPNVRVILPLE